MGNCRIMVQFVVPSLLFRGYWGPFPRGIKWLGYKAVHSPPTTPEIKADWSYTSCPIYAFTACTGTTCMVVFKYNCYLSVKLK
jgi:hypothetical protein